MSLLLDALKRAEQEKQMSRSSASDREPMITPVAANAPSANALELQSLGSAAAPGSPAARSEAAAHAAQAVFLAKQPAQAESSRAGVLIWVAVGVIAVLCAAAGGYVWLQLRALSPAPVPTYRPSRIAPTQGPPIMPAAAPTAEPGSAAPHVSSPDDPPKFVIDDSAPRPVPREQALVSEILAQKPAAAAPAAPPVTLARSVEPPRLAPEVSAGYQALRDGNIDAARRSYQKALAADGRNIDALLGMATVEARSGNRLGAIGQYRRALDVDPRNPTALAGLAALSDPAAGASVEPRLLQDIARTPADAALHFALANLYASQGRWNEAQAAYFEAHRLDPSNPDIAFDLAVSLDHLGKGHLAAEFYRRALEASRTQAAQFEPAAAQRRAAELEAPAAPSDATR